MSSFLNFSSFGDDCELGSSYVPDVYERCGTSCSQRATLVKRPHHVRPEISCGLVMKGRQVSGLGDSDKLT